MGLFISGQPRVFSGDGGAFPAAKNANTAAFSSRGYVRNFKNRKRFAFSKEEISPRRCAKRIVYESLLTTSQTKNHPMGGFCLVGMEGLEPTTSSM